MTLSKVVWFGLVGFEGSYKVTLEGKRGGCFLDISSCDVLFGLKNGPKTSWDSSVKGQGDSNNPVFEATPYMTLLADVVLSGLGVV